MRQNPIVAFYAPADNQSLAWKRRTCSIIGCCIILGLVVGLAAGLTYRRYYYNNVYGYGY